MRYNLSINQLTQKLVVFSFFVSFFMKYQKFVGSNYWCFQWTLRVVYFSKVCEILVGLIYFGQYKKFWWSSIFC